MPPGPSWVGFLFAPRRANDRDAQAALVGESDALGWAAPATGPG